MTWRLRINGFIGFALLNRVYKIGEYFYRVLDVIWRGSIVQISYQFKWRTVALVWMELTLTFWLW
jgi:hypothetical protein